MNICRIKQVLNVIRQKNGLQTKPGELNPLGGGNPLKYATAYATSFNFMLMIIKDMTMITNQNPKEVF